MTYFKLMTCYTPSTMSPLAVLVLLLSINGLMLEASSEATESSSSIASNDAKIVINQSPIMATIDDNKGRHGDQQQQPRKSMISIINTNDDQRNFNDNNDDHHAILLHELHRNTDKEVIPTEIIIEEDNLDSDDYHRHLEPLNHHFDKVYGHPIKVVPSLPPLTIINGEHRAVYEEPIKMVDSGHDQPNGRPILIHLMSANDRRKYDNGIPDLLAILAPLAAIPLIGSLAVSSFTTMLTLQGLGRRRKRDTLALSLHDKVLNFLNASAEANPGNPSSGQRPSSSHQGPRSTDDNRTNHTATVPITELFQLDIVQRYLQQSGRPDYNDEIIANYLQCRGMFSMANHCLERLACHYGDIMNGHLRPIERDVAALIIYSLLRNNHIDTSFKRRLQRAALFGYDHHAARDREGEGRAGGGGGGGSVDQSRNTSTTIEDDHHRRPQPPPPMFMNICDHEFPCPKNELP